MKKKISLFVLLFLLVLTANFQTTNAAAKKNIYKIKVNKLKNTVTVYRHTKKGKYKPYKAFVCSSGKATPVGTFSLREKYRWHALLGPSYGQYCTRIYGGFCFIRYGIISQRKIHSPMLSLIGWERWHLMDVSD